MDCEQIRQYLAEYAAGGLPGFKSAWVAQHLAGCAECRHLAGALEEAPVAPTTEVFPPGPGPESVAVQRPVPGWVRRISATAVLLLLTGLAPGAHRPAGEALPSPGSPPPSFEASMQRQLGVVLWLDSVAVQGEDVRVKARFLGHNLTLPDEGSPWVTVLDGDRRPLDVHLEGAVADEDGVMVELLFRLPKPRPEFAIRFGGVTQLVRHRWDLQLPDPPERLEHPAAPLGGVPAGATLLTYGTVGELLFIKVRAPAFLEGGTAPALQLRDAKGALFAPVRVEETGLTGAKEFFLQFPLPREVRLPLALVGDLQVRKHLGPWLIEGRLVE